LSLLDDQSSSFAPEQGLITGPVPLTPIQRWFFAQDPPEPHHFNQAMVVDLDPDLTPDIVGEAVGLVLAQHDVLRARYSRDGDSWHQYIGELPDEAPFELIDLRGLSPEEEQAAFLVHAERIQRSIDLASGPLLRAAMFDRTPPHVPGLLLVAHHLGVDAVSWPILIEDLHDVCRSLQRKGAAKLPPKSTSFKWWAQRMEEYSRSPLLLRELDYWLTVAPSDVDPLPVDKDAGLNDVGSAVTLHVPSSADVTTALLHEAPAALGTQIMDLLVGALTLAVQEWKGSPGMFVNLEGHGRSELFEGSNLFATVGWFTTLYPFFVALDPAAGLRAALDATKAALATVPNKGFGYGPLRFMTDEGARLAAAPAPQMVLNYFGRIDSAYAEGTFAPTFGETGPMISPLMPRAHLLEVNTAVARNRFQTQWTYSANRHDRATVERLAQSFDAKLAAVADEVRRGS
ncbi:MAG: condensation domain-containing protein, partial [Actinomycetota bacterium]|nr:condensation domain-containing protein [Actinomycetota bacterium]